MLEVTKWDYRFLRMAQMASSWSKDPMTKMGAVLVSEDRRHVSLGYNGFPRGVGDDERLQDRALKRKLVEHAERNCLHHCPFDPHAVNCTLYVTGSPCTDCAKAIIQKGIRRLVMLEYEFVEHWREDMELAKSMLQEAGVNYLLVNPEVVGGHHE